jgi:stearoyl-CoA desaturase (delta-9 desaturase)
VSRQSTACVATNTVDRGTASRGQSDVIWQARSRRARSRHWSTIATIGIPHLGLVMAVVAAWRWGLHWSHLVVALVMYALTAAGIEVGFHRLFAHRAFLARPELRFALAALGSMAAEGTLLFWVGVHRRHHAFADRPGDPHSPLSQTTALSGKLAAFWHAHVGWMLSGGSEDASREARDLMCDRQVMVANNLYLVWVLAGLVAPAVVGGLIEGRWGGCVQGMLWGGLTRICVGQHATWSVNSFGHLFGAAPFRIRAAARNSALLSIVTFGGTLHNNHHAFPSAASTSFRWWEVDPGGAIIKALVVTGLATIPKRPSVRAVATRGRLQATATTEEGSASC